MASACVNVVGMAPENFLEYMPLFPSCNWFGAKISSSCEISDNGASKNGVVEKIMEPGFFEVDVSGKLETERTGSDSVDFEFRLGNTVSKMLPADELFSDGKLVPLQIALAKADEECPPKAPAHSPEPMKAQLGVEIAGSDDPHEFSPKAPKCSSRWKELLGLKKAHNPKPMHQKSTLAASMAENAKSLKHFLYRNSKSSSSSDSSLSLPLLRDSDTESISISSRLSLSSSSSGADHEDFPRLSFDFDKPNPIQISATPLLRNHPRVRFTGVKSSALDGNVALRVARSRTRRIPEYGEMPPPRGGSVDSPRLNASGKVIFQGLERSSSSPSTFNGGPRHRPRGMERSYSGNVRVTPVLNVPVCTLRGSAMSVSVFGLGQLFSPQKKEKKHFNSSSNGVSSRTKAKNAKSDF
ncbi:uncharacterized protein LOC110096844 [Dendrobium catenatum]|uniref:Uncharacterized protein n=1 Tax=Dendrobium catenatum TaxID=906689 RepID=A0A2I0VJ32_9ASPA|nr:uncharacterized protein LOC110096844 [Dendrobium catenatum]PKU63426.1 hypothetical protein MA16_Dca010036 [Dendrobium catenatum]